LTSCEVVESVVIFAGACAESIELVLSDTTLSNATQNVEYYNTVGCN